MFLSDANFLLDASLTSTLGTWRPIVFNVLDECIMSKCLKFAEMTDKFTKKNPLK